MSRLSLATLPWLILCCLFLGWYSLVMIAIGVPLVVALEIWLDNRRLKKEAEYQKQYLKEQEEREQKLREQRIAERKKKKERERKEPISAEEAQKKWDEWHEKRRLEKMRMRKKS